MDWFESLTGFQETDYEDTRAKLAIEQGRLRSVVNGKSYGIGNLELISLQNLRERVGTGSGSARRLKAEMVTGEIRQMHRSAENSGAIFQVASQFNLLEMASYEVTPEHGVTRYEQDHTQGPACAIAAGAATIYRNYFVPIGADNGQTAKRQLDGLADIGNYLAANLDRPVSDFWRMRNGYALCSRPGLRAISEHIHSLASADLDRLRRKLRIGLHWDVEVTDRSPKKPQFVTQAFCSALPILDRSAARHEWNTFATLILEAAYEATMLAAILNARRGMSNVVLLTQLGGGAFGNDESWIHSALRRALALAISFDLDVKLVCYGAPTRTALEIVEDFG